MPTYLFANNAVSTLSVTATLTATTLVLQSGDGAAFPSPAANQAFVVTVQNGASYEIMRCTSRSDDVLTVTRGMDGTAAQTWNSGSSVDIRIPNLILESFAQTENTLLSTGSTMTGVLLLDDSVSTALPVVAFDGDADTGIAHPAADTLVLSTGGEERLRISALAVTPALPILAFPGSVGAPGVAFTGDANMGLYRVSEDVLGVSLGGVQKLQISGTATTLSTTLAVTGATTVGGTMGVTGAATVGGTMGVTGAATLSSTLGVTGAATVGGTLGVTGASTLASATVTAALTVGTTLGVTGAATLSSTLAVSGTATAANGTTGSQVVNFSQFPATLAETGTRTVPGGFIEKWGRSTYTFGNGQTLTVTFATAFPTACDNVQVTPNALSIGSTSQLNVNSRTASNFIIGIGVDTTLPIFWRAIGR